MNNLTDLELWFEATFCPKEGYDAIVGVETIAFFPYHDTFIQQVGDRLGVVAYAFSCLTIDLSHHGVKE